MQAKCPYTVILDDNQENGMLTETMHGKDGIQLNNSWELLRSSFPFQVCPWSQTDTFHLNLLRNSVRTQSLMLNKTLHWLVDSG